MAKNKHNESVGSNIERSDDRIRQTGEVFTPMELCRQMVNDISEDVLKNPESAFLDNSAGSGNFLYSLFEKLSEYHSPEHVRDNMIYAVEFMEDNHKELCVRMGVGTDHPHYVHADALKYHYRFDGTDPEDKNNILDDLLYSS
jgi:hypothetical protein